MPNFPPPADRRTRPLKCLGGPLDGARRRVEPGTVEFTEPVDDAHLAVYRVEPRRRARGPRFGVLLFVELRER